MPRHHRPVLRQSAALEAMDEGHDPIAALEAAHASAAALVHVGRAAQDPAVTARLVALVGDVGVDTLAELWSARPARSLPGALLRLYVLREWVVSEPDQAAREYEAGTHFSEPLHAIAGADPIGPAELRRAVDEILGGVFEGDFGVSLERASALCHVVALGRTEIVVDSTGLARAWRLRDLAEDLTACAALWRAGKLN